MSRQRGEGGAVLAIAVLFMPLALGAAALALDLARARVLRAQVQAAVDGAALSGALAAQVRQEWADVPHEHVDAGGRRWIHVHRVLVREWVEIDPLAAEQGARQAWAHNAAAMRRARLVAFEARPEGMDVYRVQARVRAPTLLGRGVGGPAEVEVAAEAVARAQPRR